MSVCCWLSWHCPRPPGTPRDARVSRQDEQSWKRCYTRASLPRTCLPRSIYRPPEKAGKRKAQIQQHKILFIYSLNESYLLYVSIVGPTDKFLQFGQTVCFRQGEDELRLHVGLSGFLSGHLEEFHQIFPIICKPQMTDQPTPGDCWSEEGSRSLLFLLAALTTSM